VLVGGDPAAWWGGQPPAFGVGAGGALASVGAAAGLAAKVVSGAPRDSLHMIDVIFSQSQCIFWLGSPS
jgi:hypothetical protein